MKMIDQESGFSLFLGFRFLTCGMHYVNYSLRKHDYTTFIHHVARGLS